jgi:hypothetical protein
VNETENSMFQYLTSLFPSIQQWAQKFLHPTGNNLLQVKPNVKQIISVLIETFVLSFEYIIHLFYFFLLFFVFV